VCRDGLRQLSISRRDGPLYPGSTKTLRDFIDRKHLLRRIDANFDFAALVEFLQAQYDPWIGRPARRRACTALVCWPRSQQGN